MFGYALRTPASMAIVTSTAPADRTVFRTCPLCEATCGLQVEIKNGAVERIRGDQDDVFSKGFIRPKGSTLKQLYEDPDRLRKPVVRRGFRDDGAPIFEEVDWDEAFAVVGEVTADVEVTDIVMPGVVSLPHGWGHGQPGARLDVAARHAGVNSNVLTDPRVIDPVSGTSVLNGIPVEVAPA